MGSIASRFVKNSLNVTGNDNNIWIINGAAFNLSSIFDPAMERLSEKIQTIIIANNLVIVTNITCIFAIIILLFLFAYLTCFYRDSAVTVVSNHSNSSLIQCSGYTIESSNENVSNYIDNDLIWHRSPSDPPYDVRWMAGTLETLTLCRYVKSNQRFRFRFRSYLFPWNKPVRYSFVFHIIKINICSSHLEWTCLLPKDKQLPMINQTKSTDFLW